MTNILDPIDQDETRRANFKGFYEIEKDLEAKGIDRKQAIKILRYLRSNEQYVEIIARMNSSDSPTECRKIEIPQCFL